MKRRNSSVIGERGTARGAVRRERLPLERIVTLALCRLGLALLLTLSSLAAAQLDLTTRLTPWPPAAWPQGAQGEVHAVTVEDVTSVDFSEENLTSIFSFPVSEMGEVTYNFPAELPRGVRRFYQAASLDDFQLCPEVAPSLSPPDTEVVLLRFALYADGAFWGVLDLSTESGSLFSVELRSFMGLLYAREPFLVVGSGYCPSEELEVTITLDLQAGLNLLEVSGTGSLAGGKMLLTTTETLDLPQTPIGIGVGMSGGAF